MVVDVGVVDVGVDVVVVFIVVLVVVGFRPEDGGGRKEVEAGVEAVEGQVGIGVEFDEEHRRRGPQLHVAAEAAQVGHDRRFHVAAVVDFDSVAAP